MAISFFDFDIPRVDRQDAARQSTHCSYCSRRIRRGLAWGRAVQDPTAYTYKSIIAM